MQTYSEFWAWIHAIQENHPHTKTTVTILDNSIIIDSADGEIAQWNNSTEIGIVTTPED